MKLAFFDTKPYDKPGFDEHIAGTDIEIKYFETRLGEDTVQLAKGFDGVCVFVNDTVNAKVAGELYDLGVRVIALRCAGCSVCSEPGFCSVSAVLESFCVSEFTCLAAQALSASTDMASRIASTFFISQTSFPQGMFRSFELLSV